MGFRTLISIFLRNTFLFTILVSSAAAVAYGQGTPSTAVRPPIGDSSLSNPNGFLVVRASGGGRNSDNAAVQAALDNSMNRPVMLVGKIDSCKTLLVPQSGMVVMENNFVFDTTRPGSTGVMNNKIRCSGPPWEGGGSFIAYNGDYATMRGIAVVGSDNGFQATSNAFATINQAVLTTTGCNIFSLGQTIVGPGVIPDTHIVKVFPCSGGNQDFWINNWTFSAGAQFTGLVACIEHLRNASFTVTRGMVVNQCSGDGYRALADGAQPGGQGQVGFIIRPQILDNGFADSNAGHGIFIDEFNNGHSTDSVVEVFNAGSNLRDGYHVRKGGQVQAHQMKIDFNAGRCMYLDEGGFTISDVMCDNNYSDPQIHVKLDSNFGEELNASNITIGNRDATPSTAIGIDSINAARLTLSGISANLPNTFAVYSGTISPVSTIQSAKTTFLDQATADQIEPIIARGVGYWRNIAPTAAAYLPDLQDGVRNFTVPLGTNCPCTLTNFAHSVAGMRGTITFVQDNVGGRTITFGDRYVIQTIPTITTTSSASTVVSYTVGQDGQIIFAPPVSLGVIGPTLVKANETTIADNVTSGNATIATVGAGNLLLVRTDWCGGSSCNVGTSTITGITGSGGTCSAVSGASNTGTGRNVALWACPNVTSGSKTLAISFGSAAYYTNVLVSEWTHANVAPVDGTVGNNYNMTNTHLVNVSTSSAVTAGTTIYAFAKNQGSFIGSPSIPPWSYVVANGNTDCWSTNRCDVYLTNAQGVVTSNFYNEFTSSDNWTATIGAFKGP